VRGYLGVRTALQRWEAPCTSDGQYAAAGDPHSQACFTRRCLAPSVLLPKHAPQCLCSLICWSGRVSVAVRAQGLEAESKLRCERCATLAGPWCSRRQASMWASARAGRPCDLCCLHASSTLYTCLSHAD
jgi:hypothetical protein